MGTELVGRVLKLKPEVEYQDGNELSVVLARGTGPSFPANELVSLLPADLPAELYPSP